MRVSLGTVEVDDATRKRIRKAMGMTGVASRSDVKEYALEKLEEVFAAAGAPAPAPAAEPTPAEPSASPGYPENSSDF